MTRVIKIYQNNDLTVGFISKYIAEVKIDKKKKLNDVIIFDL